MANIMASVSAAGLMVAATVESGKTAGPMDMVWRHGQMEQSVMMVNGKTTALFVNQRRPPLKRALRTERLQKESGLVLSWKK